MLRFDFAELVQMRAPLLVGREIVGHTFGKQNVTGVSAFHYSPRGVDSRTGDICALIHIEHFIDRAAVNSHSKLDGRMVFQSATYFQNRAPGGRIELPTKGL